MNGLIARLKKTSVTRHSLTPVKRETPHSIAKRFAVELTLATVLLSALTIAVIYFCAMREQEAELARKANEYRDYLVGALELPMWNYDDNTISAICGSFSENEHIARLSVTAPSGSTVYSLGSGRVPDALTRTGQIKHLGASLGEVDLAISRRSIKEAGRRLLSTYADIMLMVTVSLVLLTSLFVRQFLQKPIQTLDQIVRPYAQGKYDVPIPQLPYLEFQAFSRTLARMGETIRAKMQEVRDAEEKYRGIFENAMEGIFQSTPDGRYLSVNPALARIHGYGSPEEFIACVQGPHRQRVMNPRDHARFCQLMEQHGSVADFEAEDYRKEGSRIMVAINARVVRDPEGKTLYYEGSVEDITARKQREQEVRALYQALHDRARALQQSNQELESVSYSIAHDLRTPLRSIAGFSHILLQDCADKLDAEANQNLRSVNLAALRMEKLIDDLAGLLQVTRTEVHRVPVDLSAMAQSIVSDLKQLHPERRVHLVITPGLRAEADQNLLRIMLVNLIDNAWKFTGKQSAPEIEIGAMEADGERAFYVRDNGVGFEMAFAKKLFGAFERLHSSGEFPGTGIGLATVQRIIHKHEGRVWAEGEPGKGAAFYFTLSAKASARTAAARPLA